MPNWVSNQLTVTGPEEEVTRFQELAGKPYKTKGHAITPDGIQWEETTVEQALSFWNFVTPDPSIMGEYFGDDPRLPFAEAIQHKTNHWYDWNIRNWGCKWDASHVFVERVSTGKLVATYETPWSPAEPVFQQMVMAFPKLDFEYRYLEEQGWGGELHGSEGTYWIVDEWDIPNTHQERMDKVGYCHCEEADETEIEYLYDDCPKKMALTASK